MAVNATGLFIMTRTFGTHMAERGGGSIINIGSIQGMVGPDLTLYAGLIGRRRRITFLQGRLAATYAFRGSQARTAGVRVNAISPGGFYSGQDPVSFSDITLAPSSVEWPTTPTWREPSSSWRLMPPYTLPVRIFRLMAAIPRNKWSATVSYSHANLFGNLLWRNFL